MPRSEHLPSLLRFLASTLSSTDDAAEVDEALASLSPESDARSQLEEALAWLGLRLRWIAPEGLDVAAMARPDLPLLAVDAEAGGWWVFDRSSMGKVRTSSASWGDARWLKQAELPLRAPVRWARVEPMLPASPWASPPGRTASPAERLRGLLRSERTDITVVLVYAVLVGVLSLATPLAIQVLINQLAFGVVLQPILFLGLALARSWSTSSASVSSSPRGLVRKKP